ncbi:hypothetical protein NKJ90_05075 [Mesorhizobium sp. M0051]|uniref:hypothetical protein n=1 Tax=unclassified Mesorhizobium TaxID=325217 RepID=UPI0004CF2F2E|nr:hypothetical protein [Mesorhizobium sp. LNHC252B00]
MKKSLLSTLGLAVALAFTVPVIGATSADAAPMARHHRHHHHAVCHYGMHRRHHVHHHHMKNMMRKAY